MAKKWPNFTKWPIAFFHGQRISKMAKFFEICQPWLQWRAEVWWCPGRMLDWMPPLANSSIEQWRIVVIVIGYTLFVTSQHDVIFTFANQRGQWKLKKNKKIITKWVCFCSSTMLTNKAEIIETHSEFSGCPNNCINLFQVNLHKPWNYLGHCYEKTPPPPLPPFERAKGAMAPPCLHSPAFLCILLWTHSLYSLL